MKRIAQEFTFTEEQLNTVKRLAAECNLLEDTVKILYGRGADSAEKIRAFLNPSKERLLSPFTMSGMERAVELIKQAREEEWSVAVYGDYDADGVCAATILGSALRDFGIQPFVYIPERKEGYGLNVPAIDFIFDTCFPQLFITVDCGISCAEEVEYIKEQGAEVIVTDHHELPDILPDCVCVNPKFKDDYPYDNLCGAGVALKLAVALCGREAYKYIDYAAIATVADSVPLTGENRDIVYEGLRLINRSPRSNYAEFIAKAPGAVNSHTLAFTVAPRINAAGRMGDARAALNLFASADDKEISELSSKLISYNLERQQICNDLYEKAVKKLRERGAFRRVVMLADDGWNSGFVGIVAARLVEEYSRPVLLFVRHGDVLKGSARSVENVNIFEVLKACSQYIEEFGGHSQAAGVTIRAENFETLENAVDRYICEHYTSGDFAPTLLINGSADVGYAERLAREIELLEPFGVGNRRPLFELDGGAMPARRLKQGSPHLAISCDRLELMYFGGADRLDLITSAAPKRFIFEYNVSSYKGKEYIKGFVRDVVCDGGAGELIPQELAVSNLLTLAHGEVACDRLYRTAAEIDQMLSSADDYGVLCIAHEYATLSRYKSLEGMPVTPFKLYDNNNVNAVLLAPACDVRLSAFKTVVFLDSPAAVCLEALEGRKVVICSDISGYNMLKELPKSREELLSLYSFVLRNYACLTGGDSGSVALQNDFPCSPAAAAFALEVFRQLSLISYDGGELNVKRGIRTDLSLSPLYNFVIGI